MKNKLLTIAAAVSACLPLAAAAYFVAGHSALDDVFDYAPSTAIFFALVGAAAVAGAGFFAGRRFPRGWARLVVTGVPAALALLLALAFAWYVILPGLPSPGAVPKIDFIQDDPETRPLRFAAAGDAHIGNPASNAGATRDVFGRVGRDGYDLFFFLGDFVDRGFDDGLWKAALPGAAAFNRTVPVWFVPGNHDTMYGGERLYRKYALPDGDGDLWRRFDSGGAHFIVLDLEWETQTYTRDQEEWLVRELASIPRRDWCVVLCHTFFYCSGRRKDGWDWFDNKKAIERVVPLFEKYGVDLVLSGHMHQTEVLKRNGVVYAVVGSAGGKLDEGRTYVSPASVWYEQGLYGYADVSLNGRTGSLSIRDRDGRIRYRMELAAE